MSTRISQLTAATSLDGSELLEIVQAGTSKRGTAQQVSRLAAELYAATSTTSLAIGTGSKSLTTQTYLAYRGGAFVTISDANNPDTNYMSGIVTSYAPTTGAMTVNVTVVAGSGTIANWNIQPSGTQGIQGNPGAPWDGWHGAWLTATAYVSNDAVDNDGASYICTADHTSGASTEPGTGASWASYWDVLAEKGDTGTAATISVGTVTTGAAGSSASVTNVGTSSAAVLNFAIPRGDTGAAWDQWQGAWLTATAYVLNDAVENDGSSYICTQAHTSGAASKPGAGGSWTSYWDLIAAKGADGLGAGDVVGPASATDSGFARFDGVTGKRLKDGAATVAISTEVSGLGTGVATFLGTPSSANLAAAVTDETGSGALVFATSPTLVTPALGTPASATLTNATGLPIATGVSGLGTGVATFLATPSSSNLAAAVTDETGTGALVFATSPTLVTPELGTPASGTLTNCTGLPVSTGVSGLGTGVATFLATPSSANLASAVTDETGSGALVFATSPTLVTPTIGAATATSINKVAFTAPATSATVTIADGKTMTVSNSITLAGTDGTTMTFPSTSSTIKAAGKETLWVPAVVMVSRTTAGPGSGTTEMTTNKIMFKTLDFDATTTEYAQFSIRMPKSWDGSTVTAAFTWSHASTTTNFGVVWAMVAVALSDDDAGDVPFGTAQEVADTGGTTNDIYVTSTTSAITIAGSPAAEDLVVFQVKRVPADGSDTMAIDARLHGVTVYYTTNASNDA